MLILPYSDKRYTSRIISEFWKIEDKFKDKQNVLKWDYIMIDDILLYNTWVLLKC